MRIINLPAIAVTTLLLLPGCGPSGGCSGSNLFSFERPPEAGAPAPAATPAEHCERDCERSPLMVKVNPQNFHPVLLTPAQQNSLNHAVTANKGSPAPQHLDASVVNGKLVFTPHADSAHAAASTAVISVPGSDVKVVATPDAVDLLHHQTIAPPR